MNRCPHFMKTPTFSAFLALVLSFAPAAPQAFAQSEAAEPVQNEAVLGGRNFPEGTLRGAFVMVNAPEIRLDGQADRLSPGARIRSAENMLVTPASIIGQNLLVNYTRDPASLVSEVWILTPGEARVPRASADRPLLNFWPFVAASGPRDDGKTPFDQLPKFGE
jgi:hypothetical protein